MKKIILLCTILISNIAHGQLDTLFSSNAIITKMGAPLNSEFDEKNPVITGNGRFLIYTSQRGGARYNQKRREGGYDSDLFFAIRDNAESGDDWTFTGRFSPSINTELDQDEPFI